MAPWWPLDLVNIQNQTAEVEIRALCMPHVKNSQNPLVSR